MRMKKEITITRQEFHDTFSKIMAECVIDPLNVVKFALLGTIIEMEIFSVEDDDTDTEAPFKSGDAVFVTDNEGDGNKFVNQVATVTKVTNNHDCYVTNGEYEQRIYFKNLRKVKTS